MSQNDLGNAYGGNMDLPPEDQQGRGALPAGKYNVEIEKAEFKMNSSQNGTGVSLQFSVVGEKYANAKLFTWINVQNPSQECMRIGHGELGMLSRACGFPKIPASSDEFVGKYIQVNAKVREDRPDKNEVTAFHPIEGAATAPVAPPPTAPVAPPVAPPAGPPVAGGPAAPPFPPPAAPPAAPPAGAPPGMPPPPPISAPAGQAATAPAPLPWEQKK